MIASSFPHTGIAASICFASVENVSLWSGLTGIPNQKPTQQSGEPVHDGVKSRPTTHIYQVLMLTGDSLNRNAHKRAICNAKRG